MVRTAESRLRKCSAPAPDDRRQDRCSNTWHCPARWQGHVTTPLPAPARLSRCYTPYGG